MAVCVRYVGDWHIAEDRMPSGFEKFFSRMKDFDYTGEVSLKAYIKKIMVNECLMYRRSLKINYTSDECTVDVPQQGESVVVGQRILNYWYEHTELFFLSFFVA